MPATMQDHTTVTDIYHDFYNIHLNENISEFGKITRYPISSDMYNFLLDNKNKLTEIVDGKIMKDDPQKKLMLGFLSNEKIKLDPANIPAEGVTNHVYKILSEEPEKHFYINWANFLLLINVVINKTVPKDTLPYYQEAEIRKFEETKNNLLEQINHLEEENKSLREKSIMLTNFNTSLSEEKEELNRRLTTAYGTLKATNEKQLEKKSEEEKKQIENQLKSLQEALNISNRKVETLETENKSLNTKINALKISLDGEKQKTEEYEKSIADSLQKARSDHREKENLKSETQQLVDANNKMRKEFQKIQGELQSEKQRANSLETEKANLNAQIKKQNDALTTSKNQAETSEKEIMTLRKKVTDLEKQVPALKEVHQQLQTANKTNEKEKQDLQAKNTKLEEENKNCNSKIDQMSNELIKLKENLESNFHETTHEPYETQLNRQIETLEAKNVELQQKENDAQELIKKLQVTISTLEQEKSNEQQEKVRLNEKVEVLKFNLQELKKANEDLKYVSICPEEMEEMKGEKKEGDTKSTKTLRQKSLLNPFVHFKHSANATSSKTDSSDNFIRRRATKK